MIKKTNSIIYNLLNDKYNYESMFFFLQKGLRNLW